jgi:hypothetical protein
MGGPLAPGPLLRAFGALAASDPRLRRVQIGVSGAGRPIEAFRCGDQRPLLMYGFPDPGEALGAWGALRWARARLATPDPGDWVILPVLDADSQPDWENLRRPIHSAPGHASVDLFGGGDPALEQVARQIRAWAPRATLALHDEWHGDDPQPVYGFTTHTDPALSQAVRQAWADAGLTRSQQWSCPLHGPGFIDRETLAGLPGGTVWAAARASGPCGAVELSTLPGGDDAALADLQIRWAMTLVGEAPR